ncbi:MAG: metallophosphoesterase family protein [Candidatus Hodarchaeales archaeon]
MKKTQMYLLLLIVFSFGGLSNNKTLTSASILAERCTWTPSNPIAGELVEIFYDPTGGPIDPGVSSIYMNWQMIVDGNKFPAVPSQSMWPNDTTVNSWLAPSEAKTLMNKLDNGSWTVNFTLSEIPDQLVVWFSSGATVDKPSGGWVIDTFLKTGRIFPIKPALDNPLFVIPGSSAELIVNATESATDWKIFAESKSESPISLNPSASYDSEKEQWVISVTIPESMTIGLYDLRYEAIFDSTTSSRVEYNSLSVIDEVKDDYWFVIMSDPQFFRDGSYSGNKDATTGDGNYTEVLTILDLIDPEFIILPGDLTEWCDEIAMKLHKELVVDYLDVPMFMIPGNHDEFEKTGSTGNHEYGSGRGVFQRIFGPSHWTFMYGDHYFASAFSDDQHILNVPGESDWIQDVITNVPASATMKSFIMHHPLDERYYGTSENVDIASDILSWLKTSKFDYYLHGHMHTDVYSELQGIVHIGTDNAIGSNSSGFSTGIRLIHVQNDEFVKFSYDTPNPTAYTAESNPVFDPDTHEPMVSVSFSNDNDGSSKSNTATFTWKYNHSYEGARVRFAMQPTSKCYKVTGGTVKTEFTYEAVHYVDVEFDVTPKSQTTISITEIDCPTSTPANTTTTEEPTSSKGSPGFDITIIFFGVSTLVILRRKKQNS